MFDNQLATPITRENTISHREKHLRDEAVHWSILIIFGAWAILLVSMSYSTRTTVGLYSLMWFMPMKCCFYTAPIRRVHVLFSHAQCINVDSWPTDPPYDDYFPIRLGGDINQASTLKQSLQDLPLFCWVVGALRQAYREVLDQFEAYRRIGISAHIALLNSPTL